MRKITLLLVRPFVYIYLRLGILFLWSTIHRAIFDRKFKDTKLPHFYSISKIAERVRQFDWKRDGLSELFDAVCSPQKVEAVGFNNESPHGNDCDEVAIWLTNVVEENLPHFSYLSDMSGRINGACFFTVVWQENAFKFNGHNVCLLETEDGLAYMDYSNPSEFFSNPSDVANAIAKRYAGWDSTGHGTVNDVRVVLWCIASKNLIPLESGI